MVNLPQYFNLNGFQISNIWCIIIVRTVRGQSRKYIICIPNMISLAPGLVDVRYQAHLETVTFLSNLSFSYRSRVYFDFSLELQMRTWWLGVLDRWKKEGFGAFPTPLVVLAKIIAKSAFFKNSIFISLFSCQ